MTTKKIVIAGGTGFIGNYLSDKFQKQGYQVLIISRKTGSIPWTDTQAIMQALNNAEMLINLAGKSVNCRYTEKNKEEIFKSRTQTTQTLGEAILACQNPPPLWFNSSTATIYRHSEDKAMTEENGEIGSGFSIDVATAWERAFFDFNLSATRQIALRIAIVLGKEGGALMPLENLVRFGLGGKQGKGNQMFSWIHIEDLYQIILFLAENKDLKGVFNCASPHPIDNQTLMKMLRKSMKVPFGLPSPTWLLTMGAVLIGTETELVLKSRWVLPERLLKSGFTFRFSDLTSTLEDFYG
ncbi:MAG: TIGR01777 family protein [Verrucomicrobia bacterium]|nr:TIGR01777 family protein [Cytophagales bacterium]